MNTTDLAQLLRSLATTPSRRGVTRSLAGLVLGGALSSLLGAGDLDAKRRKKEQPFCAGNNTCVQASPNCDDGSGDACTCFVTVKGKPFCGTGFRIDACAGCVEGETCIDISGPICGDTTACAFHCPTPR